MNSPQNLGSLLILGLKHLDEVPNRATRAAMLRTAARAFRDLDLEQLADQASATAAMIEEAESSQLSFCRILHTLPFPPASVPSPSLSPGGLGAPPAPPDHA